MYYYNVLQPCFKGYNGSMGDFKCLINMLPVLHKSRLPHKRDTLIDLQHKCDEFESGSFAYTRGN